uniref:Uncharacterized protein n=1 Tax=Setaria viridis TaxID=4556 RepID=A0A4U6T7Y8_SETVI|nr:hypothetical protein SEVIR_9G528750v2 [Setaria viridis]
MSHRQFLNLALRCSHGLYSVNHPDTSPLFYKPAAAAAKSKVGGSTGALGPGVSRSSVRHPRSMRSKEIA